MTLLNEEQASRISELIESVERQTDAELVTVLARRSDEYVYIPTLWAALASLLFPWVLGFTSFWLETREILIAQLSVFISLAILLRWTPVMMKLVPRRVRLDRASKMARRQFLEQNLHHTNGETGLLIFVSEAEHYVEILADRGISKLVSDDRWNEIVARFVVHVKVGETLEGFEECVKSCGEILVECIPATCQKNELPNHLIVLGS